ncbi:hypothetical protein GCM10009817_38060 [Terrabacter lapilli]|uniref:Tight adherence protein B n=1 Tax=Terrabacter lapilli TaxID=436231 RepID=A0ABN2SVK8_9MICO
MSAQGPAVVGALLLGAAVLVWPRPGSGRAALADALSSTRATAATQPADGSLRNSRSLWREDPVELYRRWRLRRRPGVLVEDVLELLRGIGPALEAGLTPVRAIELAATSTLGTERVVRARAAVRLPRGRRGSRGSRRGGSAFPDGPGVDDARTTDRPGTGSSGEAAHGAPVAEIDRLVGALLQASEHAEPASQVWTEWARHSGSAELTLVAAAWRLSETTGAPLASAVERAVRGLLDARTRRGKVAVAVAGPRATVTVLTLLPLTGPLFGLACGVDPARLYLGSPIATASAAAGLLLVWTGRVWCSRMVRRAVGP